MLLFFLLASQNKTGRRRFGQNEDFSPFLLFFIFFQEDARTVLRMASGSRRFFDYFFCYNLSLSVIVIQIWRVFDNGIFLVLSLLLI